MLKRCIALSLIATLSSSTGYAQIAVYIPKLPIKKTPPAKVPVKPTILVVTHSGPGGNILPTRPRTSINGGSAPNQLPGPNEASGYNRTNNVLAAQKKRDMDNWHQSAEKGDMDAVYKIGRSYETGNVTYPPQPPDLLQAVNWYNRAVNSGNLNAMYRLGTLASSRRVQVVDASGNAQEGVENGKKMVQYAIAHGYKPETDTVGPPPSDFTGFVVGATVLATLFGLAMSGGSSTTSAADSNDDWSLRCSLPSPNLDGTQSWYFAFGPSCKSPYARFVSQ